MAMQRAAKVADKKALTFKTMLVLSHEFGLRLLMYRAGVQPFTVERPARLVATQWPPAHVIAVGSAGELCPRTLWRGRNKLPWTSGPFAYEPDS